MAIDRLFLNVYLIWIVGGPQIACQVFVVKKGLY